MFYEYFVKKKVHKYVDKRIQHPIFSSHCKVGIPEFNATDGCNCNYMPK